MANPGIDALTPFRIDVSDEQLDDLRARLRAMRWPIDVGNEDWYYGVNGAYLKDLVGYWRDGFDWRAAERRLNGFGNYRVMVDGMPIHFMHVPGKGPAPIPLILSHGWPWSYLDWIKVVEPLADPAAFGGDPADAFDVIVPSLPGFGFSTPLTLPDTNFSTAADAFHKLMTEVLGNDRYAAGGSDMGAFLTGQLGHKYADSLYGVYLAHGLPLDFWNSERPWDVSKGFMVPAGASPVERDGILDWQRRFVSHAVVHVLDSETQAYGLNDSPVGMLAWLLERWRNWSDCNDNIESVFTRDHMLTSATIWWVTQSIRSSMRIYANAARYMWQPSHDLKPIVQAPAGMTFVGYENPPGVSTEGRVAAWNRSGTAKWFDSVYLKAHDHGGHFVPYENPDAVIADVRATFRLLR